MCLWEALFAGLAAVAAGFALGCGAAAVGLGLQKHLSFLAVPAASLVPLAVLFLLSVLLGALLPAVLVRPQTAKPKEKPAKIPLGTAAACTADRCRLRGIADRRQLFVCRLACHAAI